MLTLPHAASGQGTTGDRGGRTLVIASSRATCHCRSSRTQCPLEGLCRSTQSASNEGVGMSQPKDLYTKPSTRNCSGSDGRRRLRKKASWTGGPVGLCEDDRSGRNGEQNWSPYNKDCSAPGRSHTALDANSNPDQHWGRCIGKWGRSNGATGNGPTQLAGLSTDFCPVRTETAT